VLHVRLEAGFCRGVIEDVGDLAYAAPMELLFVWFLLTTKMTLLAELISDLKLEI
jgi:hypothetical protein